jgi:hypothetical protein
MMSPLKSRAILLMELIGDACDELIGNQSLKRSRLGCFKRPLRAMALRISACDLDRAAGELFDGQFHSSAPVIVTCAQGPDSISERPGQALETVSNPLQMADNLYLYDGHF